MRLAQRFNVDGNCLTCHVRVGHTFCNLHAQALQTMERIKRGCVHPKGTVLFEEGDPPRGVFIVCAGRVKLSMSSSDGKLLFLRNAAAGEVLGASACICGTCYEGTAETDEACYISFVNRSDFLQMMQQHRESCFRVAQQLSENCDRVRQQISWLPRSALAKLVELLLDYVETRGERPETEYHLRLPLTHDEIAERIGTARETVTRLIIELKKRQILEEEDDDDLLVRNKALLQAIASGRVPALRWRVRPKDHSADKMPA